MSAARGTIGRGRAKLAAGLLLAGLNTGCSTFLDSELAGTFTDGREGQVYYLPMPVLMVTPKTDGTMDVTVEYIPDPSKKYVLRAKSLISDYTLDVRTSNGILESVSLDSDASAVAKSATEASLAIADKAYTAAKEAREAKAKELATNAAKERELVEAVALAKQRLAKMTLLSKDPKNGISQEELAAEELKVEEAEAKLAVFRAKSLEDLNALATGAGLDVAKKSTKDTAPGPVLLQVLMSRQGDAQPVTTLRPLAGQERFEAPDTSKKAEKPVLPRLQLNGSANVTRSKKGELAAYTLKFNTDVMLGSGGVADDTYRGRAATFDGLAKLPDKSVAGSGVAILPGEKASEIRFELPGSFEDGFYRLTLHVVGKGLKTETPVTVNIQLATTPAN